MSYCLKIIVRVSAVLEISLNLLFPANLFKLLDKTNPNMKDEGILLLTLSHPSSLGLLLLSFVPNTKTVLRVFFL